MSTFTWVKSVGRKIQAQAELGQRVERRLRVCRVQRPRRIRAGGLDPGLDALGVGEGGELLLVGGRERQQVTEHEHGAALADRDLDLGQAIRDRQPGQQRAQARQQRRDRRRQHRAGVHIDDVARAALVEAHAQPALAPHHAHAQARAVTITPGGAVDRRQDPPGAQLADVAQRVLEDALLHSGLRIRIQMLHGAASAHAVMRAARRHALGARAQHAHGLALLVTRFGPPHHIFDALARQGALDEHRLAIDAGHAAAFVVQGIDLGCRHGRRERV